MIYLFTLLQYTYSNIVIPGLTGDLRTTVSYFYPKTSQRSTLDAATQDFRAKHLFRENIFIFRLTLVSLFQVSGIISVSFLYESFVS